MQKTLNQEILHPDCDVLNDSTTRWQALESHGSDASFGFVVLKYVAKFNSWSHRDRGYFITLSLHYLKKVMFIVTKDVRLGANSNEQNGSVPLGIAVLSVGVSVHLH